ncbi:MAG: nuclear transport factor 2 family protein [Phycisphaerales bacterium]|nr:nuclear transport factor 2 family protein [Planctomycetota bacterium]
MTLTPERANAFAARWYGAWNAHDLPAILACYEPEIRHSSPFIKRYNEAIGRGDEAVIAGLEDLGSYFGRALARNPRLRFDGQHLATGLESVILVYRRHSHDTPPGGELSAEVFFLSPRDRIVRSVSHYG